MKLKKLGFAKTCTLFPFYKSLCPSIAVRNGDEDKVPDFDKNMITNKGGIRGWAYWCH